MERTIKLSSDKTTLACCKPENIKTDKLFSNEDVAVRLHNNHALTEIELHDLQKGLQIMLDTMQITKNKVIDLKPYEKRLDITLPPEIHILYQNIMQAEYFFAGSERFLLPEELYIDDGNLVFFKRKRTPVAISLSKGGVMSYYKKQWQYHFDENNFLQFALSNTFVTSVLQMPVHKRGRIKGELVRTMYPKEKLQQIFSEKLTVLNEYKNYGNLLLFNKASALAFFRQNGFYADILIGCQNQSLFHDIISTELPVKWQESLIWQNGNRI